MIIGIKYKNSCILAADKALVLNNFTISSNEKKIETIIKDSIIITGAGLKSALVHIKNSLKNYHFYSIEEILLHINKEKELLIKKGYSKKDMETTSFLVAYKAENPQIVIHYPKHYMEKDNIKYEEAINISELVDKYLVIFPPDIDESTRIIINSKLNILAKTKQGLNVVEKDLKDIFLIASQNSKQVSSEFDFEVIN